MKRQPLEWEKIIANETDKGLIFKIYTQLIQLNTRKPNNPIKNWALGVGDGQGGLVCCSPWGHKELDTTEQLN